MPRYRVASIRKSPRDSAVTEYDFFYYKISELFTLENFQIRAYEYVLLELNQYCFVCCSDKCLNQFKLDIFCQETKEHLEIHPHHCEQLKDIRNIPISSLITPDLWLRNCSSSTPGSEKRIRSTRKSSSPALKQLSLIPHPTKYKEYPVPVPVTMSSAAVVTLCATSTEKDTNTKIISNTTPSPSSALPYKDKFPNDANYESALLAEPSLKASTSFVSSLTPSKNDTGIPATWLLDTSRTMNDYEHPRSGLTKKSSSHNNSRIPPLLPLINYKRPSSVDPTASSSSVMATSQAASLLTKSSVFSPTLLVPYPVILPIPIPFPVPIPLPIIVNEATNNNKHTNFETECEVMRSNSTSPKDTDAQGSTCMNSVWSLSLTPHSSPGSIETRPYNSDTNGNKIKKFKKN